ncbi:pentapeptide repeat-containing protein [Magnetococcales bacterium HHB-1]
MPEENSEKERNFIGTFKEYIAEVEKKDLDIIDLSGIVFNNKMEVISMHEKDPNSTYSVVIVRLKKPKHFIISKNKFLKDFNISGSVLLSMKISDSTFEEKFEVYSHLRNMSISNCTFEGRVRINHHPRRLDNQSEAIIKVRETNFGSDLEIFGHVEKTMIENAKFISISNSELASIPKIDVRGEEIHFHNITLHQALEISISAKKTSIINARFMEELKFSTSGQGEVSFLEVDFNKTTFNQVGKEVCFEKCTFEKETDFKGPFEKKVHFIGSRFKNFISFYETKFNSSLIMDSVKFDSLADFGTSLSRREALPFNEITFQKTTFSEAANFKNRKFSDSCCFSEVTFHKAPEFHNAELHQDTRFQDTKFSDTQSDHAENSYRTLKLAMESIGAKDDEMRFHALELKSRANKKGAKIALKLFTKAYEIGSDFGQSISRPLVIMFVGFSLFFLLYGVLYHQSVPQLGSFPSIMRELFIFTMQSYVQPFAVWSGKFLSHAPETIQQFMNSYPLLIRLLATLQTILGAGLLTLFFLALRRKFKLE